MAGMWSRSTWQIGDERAAVGQTLSADSWRGDCLSRNQTAGNLLSMLCAHRDGCDEDRRAGGGVSENQEMQEAWIRINQDSGRGREAGESDHVSTLQKADTGKSDLVERFFLMGPCGSLIGWDYGRFLSARKFVKAGTCLVDSRNVARVMTLGR